MILFEVVNYFAAFREDFCIFLVVKSGEMVNHNSEEVVTIAILFL